MIPDAPIEYDNPYDSNTVLTQQINEYIYLKYYS